MGRKQKTAGLYNSLSGVADVLVELADRIRNMEKGSSASPAASTEVFRKMEITIKPDSGGFSVKTRTKLPDPVDKKSRETGVPEQLGTGRPKYKHLKKRMQRRFKEIKIALENGDFPSTECVDEFLQDSELMVAYPGYGDEHYDAYTRICTAFQTAYVEKDRTNLKKCYQRLKQSKDLCHDQYK